MKNLNVYSFFVLVVLLGLCCNIEEKKAMPSLNLILPDLSGSTNREEIRAAYLDNFCTIYSHAKEGDRLIISWITESSDDELQIPIDIKIPEPRSMWRKNPIQEFYLKKKMEEARDLAVRELEKFLFQQNRKINKTSIFASLKLAGQILQGFPNYKKKLFIFSDMIEQTSSYDFSKIKFDEDIIQKIIEKEKKIGRMPNLNSVNIYIAGAGSSKLRISEIQEEQIEKFWRAYYQATKGILVQYSGPLIRMLNSNQ